MKLRTLRIPGLALFVWLALSVGSAQQSGRPTPKPKPSPKDDCCVMELSIPGAQNRASNTGDRIAESSLQVEGNAASRVRVIIYEDLQCPDCATFRKALDGVLLPRYGSSVAFEHRDFPLPKHSWAKEAAIAARYFQTLDPKISVQFRRHMLGRISATSAIGFRDALIGFCREYQLDAEKALTALTDAQHVRAVDKEFQDGVAAGVRRTPTVVIAGKEFVETINLDEIQRVLDDLLGKSPASR